MSQVTLDPNTTPNSNLVPGTGDFFPQLSDDSDATYVDLSEPGAWVEIGFDNPVVASPAWKAEVTIRAGTQVAGPNEDMRVELFKSNGTRVANGDLIIGGSGSIINNTLTWTSAITQTDANGLYVRVTGLSPNASFWRRLYKVSIKIFSAEAPDAPTMTGPTATVTTTKTPKATWTHNPGVDETGGQSQYRVQLRFAGGATIQDTTWRVGSASQFTLPAIANQGSYEVRAATANTTNGTIQYSSWSAWRAFATNAPVLTPTSVLPGEGSIQSTGYPLLDGRATNPVYPVKRVWQIDDDPAFGSPIEVEDERANSSPNFVSYVLRDSATRVPQGSWNVRCRFVDSSGKIGSWSAPHAFTVAHVPTATVASYSGAQSLGWATSITVSWNFSDPWPLDEQTAYETEVWLASDKVGTVITNSGGSAKSAVVTGIGAPWKDVEARWRVRVQDLDGVWSAWSLEGVFTLQDLPVVTITDPVAAGEVTSPSPTIEWTFAATLARTQLRYQVKISEAGGGLVSDSGLVTGDDLSWTVPSPILQVNTDYSVSVLLTDNTGLVGQSTHQFTAVYPSPEPPTFTVDTSIFEDRGQITLDWASAVVDGTNTGWRVYRRVPNAAWDLIYDGAQDPDTKIYYDFTAPSSTDFEYAVVQVTENFGDLVESPYPAQLVNEPSSHYFLVLPEDPTLNLRLDLVTSDDFEDEQEMVTTGLIGRGRRVEYGTEFGYLGSLTAIFYGNSEITARQQRLWLEAIRGSGLTVYLRNPFGDVFEVAMSNASISRMAGRGSQEHCTATITYEEITA